MSTHIFVQARMGSTRLPGKVLMKAGGKTMFSILIERLKRVNGIDKIILLTSNDKKNDILIEEAKSLGIDCFRGSEENVLDRFYQASLKFKPDIIIRVGGDCPIIDPDLISEGLEIFKKGNYDMVSNARVRTFPDGMDFEIFDAKAIKTAWEDSLEKFNNGKESFDKAFIAPDDYILEEKKFKNKDILNKENLSCIRLTLDYDKDYELIKKVYENLSQNKNFGLKEIMEFLNNNPDLCKINEEYINFAQGFGNKK